MTRYLMAALAAATVTLAACGSQPASPVTGNIAQPTSPAASISPASTSAAAAPATSQQPHHALDAAGLLLVHDPGEVTGTLAGPCHARHHGLLPDPHCTPGSVDPAVTQADIASTICQDGWTSTVRPPETQTENFKWNVAEPAYGQQNVSGELDHLVPLELGGSNDATNLWVEAGPIPNAKDAVESGLNHEVCDGTLSLRAAQREIARNWLAVAASLGLPTGSAPVAAPPPPPPSAPSQAPPSAWCSASASYSASYGDWSVYVRSNQPDRTATASAGGYSHSWHTDGSGNAVIYLRGPSAGETITVTVGAATCSAAT
jgi:hypothetical protein